MACSTPALPVHHQLQEPTQTHVHWVSDAIQPSHPLLPPASPSFNLSQHQGLLQGQFSVSGGQSIGVSASTSVLPMNIQDWFPLGWTCWIYLQSKGLSKVFSNTIVQRQQFFSTPGSAVLYCLLEFAQTHVHWVGDAIQPSHPLSSSSPPVCNLSQHQGLFQWVSSSNQVAKVYWSFSFSISPSNEYSRLISFRMD